MPRTMEQANIGCRIDARRAQAQTQHDDDEIEAIFTEMRMMARDLPSFRERIAGDKMMLSLALLVELSQMRRVVRAIERELDDYDLWHAD